MSIRGTELLRNARREARAIVKKRSDLSHEASAKRESEHPFGARCYKLAVDEDALRIVRVMRGTE